MIADIFSHFLDIDSHLLDIFSHLPSMVEQHGDSLNTIQVQLARGRSTYARIQGYLAHKKPHPPRTLP